jgi:aryl-alcohol dehydrogenase-like predicted oxidoreductase
VPFDEQVAAMVALRDEGLIGAIGLSKVTLDQYRSARRACVPRGHLVSRVALLCRVCPICQFFSSCEDLAALT